MKLNRVTYQIPKGGKGFHGRASKMDDVINECTTCYSSALEKDYCWRTREVWKSLFQVPFNPRLKDWHAARNKGSLSHRCNGRWLIEMGLFFINENKDIWLNCNFLKCTGKRETPEHFIFKYFTILGNISMCFRFTLPFIPQSSFGICVPQAKLHLVPWNPFIYTASIYHTP